VIESRLREELIMAVRVEKSSYDPEDGFLYYVVFKPNLALGEDAVRARMPVQAAVSLSETGDLADVAFTVPKQCRNETALSFVRTQADYVEPRVFVAIPGSSGDAVVSAPAKLDLDAAGRIVGMEIQFQPEDVAQA